MNEIKAILRSERKIENGKTVQVYEVGDYEVVIRGKKDDLSIPVFVGIRRKSYRRYLPAVCVYEHEDQDDNILIDVWVDTTSYGSMPLDKIDSFMEAMRDGIAAAKYIKDTFVKPIERHTWNWEVM